MIQFLFAISHFFNKFLNHACNIIAPEIAERHLCFIAPGPIGSNVIWAMNQSEPSSQITGSVQFAGFGSTTSEIQTPVSPDLSGSPASHNGFWAYAFSKPFRMRQLKKVLIGAGCAIVMAAILVVIMMLAL